MGLNDIGGVGNEAECELIMYNKTVVNDMDKKNLSRKSELKNINKNEKKEDQKSYSSDKTEYHEEYNFENYYCTYLFFRGTVPIRMKIEIESIFSKPIMVMFFILYVYIINN
jgi:hypothetical protein